MDLQSTTHAIRSIVLNQQPWNPLRGWTVYTEELWEIMNFSGILRIRNDKVTWTINAND